MEKEHTGLRFSRAGIHRLGPSATLSMNDRVREMWDRGRKVYQLGFGESRFPVPSEVAEAMRASTHRRSYLPALGIEELREVIAQFYARRFQMVVCPGQVVIGPGSKSLLYALIMALGEEVILPQPSWVSYSTQAQIVGKPVLSVPMRFGSAYSLEVEVLREELVKARANRRNPDLLIVNRPHNPTGTMMPPDRVQALAEFAREEQLMVLSDEIYALVGHGRIPHKSVAHFYPEGTIVLGGLSKHLSLGGWRFGVAILPAGSAGEKLGRTLQSIAGNIWSSVTAPVQYAALVAYGDDPAIESYIDACARMHAIRTWYLYERLVEAGIACVEPSGAFYAYPSFNRWQEPLADKGIDSSDDLAKHLLDEYELATLPGSVFGSPPGDLSLRLSSSYLDTGTDAEAASLANAFKEDPDPERFIENHHPELREVCTRLAEFAAVLEPNPDPRRLAGGPRS